MADTLDGLDVAICVLDEADRVCLWNRSLTQLFPEHTGQMAIGEPYRHMLRRFYQARLSAQALSAIDHHIDEAVGQHPMAQPFDFEHHGMAISAASLPVPGVGRIHLWHEQRQPHQMREAERRARESERVLQEKSALLEATLERMEQGVMMINAERVVEVCNRRARELLDLPQALMDSRPTLEALAQYQTAHGEFDHASPDLVARVNAGGIFNQAYAYDRKRPNGRVIEVSSVPTENGGVLRTYTDITERNRAEERIRHVARHDGLTSLVNREVFLECLSAALADPVRRAEGFAVHFIDIDRFKPINDRCGHAIGDKVLALLAERMRLVARDVDVVARMGGDEFAVLQYHVDHAEGALGLAHRLRDGVASPMEIESHRLRVGASVGIALYRPEDRVAEKPGTKRRLQTADSLLRHADTAMYAAKATDGVRLFGQDGLDSDWAEIRS